MSCLSERRQDQIAKTVEDAANTSAEALARISMVRDAAGRISEQATSLSRLVEEMDGLGDQADPESLLGGAGRSAKKGAGVLDTMNTWELQTLLEMSERRALKMKFISMMVKTDAATESRSSEQTSGFADDLEQLVSTVRATTRAASKGAQPIPRKVNSAKEELVSAAKSLRKTAGDLDRQKRHSKSLLAARDQEINRFNTEAQAISMTSGEQISRLIPILQFSDAFTQRLENTKRFLDDAEVKDQDTRAQASYLAARQIELLAADSRRERTNAAGAIDQLFDASMRSYQILLGKKNDDAVARWVTASTEVLTMTADAIEVSSKQLGKAFDRVDDAYAATSDVTAKIREFDDLIHVLHIEALNGAIAASHSDNTRSAAYVLAAEVRVAAGECAEILSACMQELGRTESKLGDLDREAIETAVAALSNGLEVARDLQEAQRRNIEEQSSARDLLSMALKDVLKACRQARQAFHSGATMESALEALAATLAAEGSNAATSDGVAWIWPYYTTQAERALHESLVGPVSGEAGDNSENEEEDDLDGFVL